jgi:hypothetical protein
VSAVLVPILRCVRHPHSGGVVLRLRFGGCAARSTGCRSLDKIALMPGAHWQPDDARGTCNLCDEAFALTKRRHHCRCDTVLCAPCSATGKP